MSSGGGGGEGCEGLSGGGVNGVGVSKVGSSGRDAELVQLRCARVLCGCARGLQRWWVLVGWLGRVVSGFVGVYV